MLENLKGFSKLNRNELAKVNGGFNEVIYCVDLDPQNGTTVDVICGTEKEVKDAIQDYE